MTHITSKEVVHRFFNAFGQGDFQGILDSFADDCTIIGIRNKPRTENEIYGTYKGKEGVQEFLKVMMTHFETQSFNVQRILGEGDIAFANGNFTHIVKATRKEFSSDWALMCVIKDGKIFEHHFYEDSEMYARTSNQ